MFPIRCPTFIYQGADWKSVLRWFSETTTHKVITGVTLGLPTLLTVTGHGITSTDAVPVWITSVDGPRQVNTEGYNSAEPRWATVVDADTLAIDFDSGTLRPYISGGVLTYRTPVDLSGWTARQEIRASDAATEVLNLLTTENGGITLGSDGTITRHITADDTEALDPSAAVYKLDLTDADGVVTRFAMGPVMLSRDFPDADA